MKLYELINLPWEIPLDESGDAIANLKWTKSGTYEKAKFEVNGTVYQIAIVQKPVDTVPGLSNLKGKKTAELSFIEGEATTPEYGTTGKAKSSSNKIYGVVLNAAAERFNDYDALIFVAKRADSQSEKQYKTKARIYQAGAERLARMNNAWSRSKEVSGGIAFIVTKVPIDINEWFNQWEQMIISDKSKPVIV